MTQQRVIGLQARGTTPDMPTSREIKGSTTIVELLRMFPGGEAADLLAHLSPWPARIAAAPSTSH